jgi:short-subunit dehydrogenase
MARRLAREPGARLVLVARSGDALEALAGELGGATVIATDLTDPGAPARIREAVEAEHGELHLLVNNAGASWRGRFAEAGWANVERHMKLDFEAPVRLTEALLPLLRATAAGAPSATAAADAAAAAPGHAAPVSIVNVASTAGRVARPGAAAYSAAKFALAGWTDGLHLEEREHGVHVGLVLPGFVKTEGFPSTELLERRATRWMVSTPEAVAEAIMDAGPGGRPERYIPRFYWIFAALRALAPRLVRRATGGGAFTTIVGHN